MAEFMRFSMKQARVLTDQEFKRVMAVVLQGRHAARDRAALMLSYYAGLRVGEIAGLRIDDIYDAEGAVREQVRLSSAITKGGHARTVFVNDKLRRELQRYRDTLGTSAKPDRPLIRTQKLTRFSANTLCQLFARLYAEAGIDGASSHSGRRWFITRLAHAAVSPKVIMELAGHKHLTTTQRYIEVNDQMKRAAVEVL
jgi:integrase/recombinase XerD